MDVAKAAADRRAVQRIERQLLGRVSGKSCAHMVVTVARPPAIFEAESGARGDVVDPAAQRKGVEIFFARNCGSSRRRVRIIEKGGAEPPLQIVERRFGVKRELLTGGAFHEADRKSTV